MKVVLLFDQGLAGAGGKSNPNAGLAAVKGGVGTALMLEPHFAKIDATILATLYCGTQFYLDHQEEVVKKMTAMCQKLEPDVVVCGPCFNFFDYSKMACAIAQSVKDHTSIPVVAMMSQENEQTIAQYKDQFPIVKMPKKGGTGLTDSYVHLCQVLTAIDRHQAIDSSLCY